jgi:hypothetical protein
MPKVTTTIATIAPSLRQAGTITAPTLQANQISVPVDASSSRFTLNISLADKLAVGNTLTWAFEFSADNGQTWQRTNAATWLSYGPNGYFDSINNVQNPDPYLEIPLTLRHDQLIHMVLKLNQPLTIGLTVSVS